MNPMDWDPENLCVTIFNLIFVLEDFPSLDLPHRIYCRIWIYQREASTLLCTVNGDLETP